MSDPYATLPKRDYWVAQTWVPVVPTVNVQSGYHCKKCNCRNEYAGPEHLNKDGVYICYECK